MLKGRELIHRAAFSPPRYSDRKEAAPAGLKLVVVQKALRYISLISASIELDRKMIYMGERVHEQNLCPNWRPYTCLC